MQRRHDPTSLGHAAPAGGDPAGRASALWLRPHRRRDRRRPAPRRPPRGAPRRPRRLGGRARGRERLQPAGGARARRRRPSPPPAAGRAAALHALDAARLRAGADRVVGRARRLHGGLGGLGGADHGAAAGRARGAPRGFRAARARVPARQLHPRRPRGPQARPHLPPGRGARPLRGRGGRLRPPGGDARAARAGGPRGAPRPRAVRDAESAVEAATGVRASRHPARLHDLLGVLDRVEALGYDVLGRRPRLPAWQLPLVALAALRR